MMDISIEYIKLLDIKIFFVYRYNINTFTIDSIY